MAVQKLSTRFAFESSLVLRSFAEEFEKKRDMTTFVRLLMVISATTNWVALDSLNAYLKETSDKRIDPDWDEYLKTAVDVPEQGMPF